MPRRDWKTGPVPFFALLLAAQLATAAPVPCTSLTKLKLPGFAMTIEKAELVPPGPIPMPPYGPPMTGKLPAYCRADGVIDKRMGRNGRPYAIGFEIALPVKWNGRFLFQGGGGFNGAVYPSIGWQAAGTEVALARGYAIVNTDSGHKGAVFDGTFWEDQDATVNFLYRAIDKVTQVSKKIIAAHYGRAPAHSYYVGCSTGGREAMIMSQRFPDYFDGVVSGDPAMRTSYSGLADRWVAIALNQIAPRDEKGLPVAARAFSPAEKRLIHDALLEKCDAQDGAKDGMIFDVRGCDFDPQTLVCQGPKTDACLSQAQADAIAKGFAGPKDSHGTQVYPGFWYDTGITTTVGVPGLLSGPSPIVFPIDTSLSMDVDHEAALAATPVAALGDTEDWTLLNSFAARGGKLLFFHGVSDPWFSAKDTTQYYERLTADNGGRDAVMKWSRLFLVPGMGHCLGGEAALDQFDLLGAVVDWVEKGKAPDSVDATGVAFPGRSRPLCAYPMHAQYKGTGDMQKAENFECRG